MWKTVAMYCVRLHVRATRVQEDALPSHASCNRRAMDGRMGIVLETRTKSE